MYNMTQLQEADTMYGLWVYANDSSGLILMGLLMVAVFFVMIMALKGWGFDEALLASSFTCFVLSMILAYASLLNFGFVYLFFVVMALSALYIFMIKKQQ